MVDVRGHDDLGCVTDGQIEDALDRIVQFDRVHTDAAEVDDRVTPIGRFRAGGTGERSLVSFRDTTGRTLALVYLYKQGTFYPFAPKPGPGQQRDNLLEMQVRDLVRSDLPVEADLQRWMPVWGAPGLNP